MTIGTAMFHVTNARAFQRLGAEIADLQVQVSDGKNDPRPSADPVRAARLSAGKEQEARLDRFSANLDRTGARLDQTDTTLGQAGNVLGRLNEIAVRGASQSVAPDERAALRTEAVELRRMLVDLGNAADEMGRPLFSGFRAEGPVFAETGGGVAYRGDGGQHRLKVSESVTLATGLNGGEVFMAVPDATGQRRDLFGMVDDLIRTLHSDGGDLTETVTGQGGMAVTLDLTRDPMRWTLGVEGPLGRADIAVDLSAAAPGAAVDAINARTGTTGLTATLADDGRSLILSGDGPVGLTRLATDPARGGILGRARAEGQPEVPVVAPGRSAPSQIAALRSAAGHIADARAEVGAMGAVVERHGDLITQRRTSLSEAIAGLEDLDIAGAVTRLQSLLLTRDASQQTYVRIGQSSLFDYIR